MLITKTVEVTKELLDADINVSDRCRTCPVARGIELATGCPVIVGDDYWRFTSETYLRRHPLPLAITQNIRDIDNFRSVAPFSFPITYDT